VAEVQAVAAPHRTQHELGTLTTTIEPTPVAT
jgi:hypothetical protein